MTRIATHNQESIKRLLDSGADGIIAPSIDTPEQVEKLIEWVKYPPIGKRGYGIARAQGYGYNFSEYTKNWNNVANLIIQIESITAVEKIEKLLNFEEVDGAMVGPYDISGSLGIPGKIEDEKVKNASQLVINACKKLGKSCGTHDIQPTSSRIRNAIDSGFTFIVLASDVFILWKWGENIKKIVKENI